MIVSGSELQWQMAYKGGPTPVKTGFLKCSRCLDSLNPQRKLLILPVDPAPFFNVRPENYAVDETNWLTTQGNDIITTQSGDEFITSIPNPANVANTAYLIASLVYPSGSVAVAYLDLFNGNPLIGGTSILALITGSATRTNVASGLTTTSGIAKNTSPLTVSTSSASVTNVNYVGIYDAATGGNLLVSGPVSVAGQSIGLGTAVQFNSLGLSINLN